jgi:prepilin-type N-terminal cleavage/methylation domain-containing protein
MNSTNKKRTQGFSFIELMVVLSIVGVLSSIFLINFRDSAKSEGARNQTASVFETQLRRAQSKALSGAQFNDEPVCGYGMHYLGLNEYAIYVVDHPGNCDLADKHYSGSYSVEVERMRFRNKNMRFDSSFFDIYFESPESTVYVDGSPITIPAEILIRAVDENTCIVPDTCARITVHPYGRIDIEK